MSTVPERFTAADDLLHDIADRPHGRESLFWVLPVPEERLLAVVYLWRDGATGLFGRQVSVGSELSTDPIFFDAVDGVELEGDDLDDAVVAGLHVRQPTPLLTAELAFSAPGFALEAAFTGIHAPFSWHENPDGCPSYVADDRYEQSTRTRGRFVVGDREVEFSGIGHRDHSWGARDWRPIQHWKWMNATAHDEDVSVHGFISFALGQRLVNGYVNRHGALSPIVRADVTHELDERLMHTALQGEFHTADGDSIALDVTSVVAVPLPTRHLQLNEVACTGTLGGLPATAHVELAWPQAFVDDWIGGG